MHELPNWIHRSASNFFLNASQLMYFASVSAALPRKPADATDKNESRAFQRDFKHSLGKLRK